MAQACLLDRLLYIANPRAIAGMSPELVGQQSIMRHLTLLLNTRKGSVPIDPDYGLSDMNNIAGHFPLARAKTFVWRSFSRLIATSRGS